MSKQWSLPEVAYLLDYGGMKGLRDGGVKSRIKRFKHFLKAFGVSCLYQGNHLHHAPPDNQSYWSDHNDKQGVFEVCCGPPTVPIILGETIRKYVGIDINSVCLETCAHQKHLGSYQIDDVKFFNQDVEKEFSEDLKKEIEDCNVCYIDGSFGILEDPIATMKKLVDNFDWIFLDRVSIADETQNTPHVWSGMIYPSPNWTFNKTFFLNFCDCVFTESPAFTQGCHSVITTLAMNTNQITGNTP